MGTIKAAFLGTADGHTSKLAREHTGILLQTDESTILLDCGASVSQYLLFNKFDPNVPEILWISHMHSDHVAHVSMLFQSLWLRKRKAPLHVYGPGPALEDLQAWLIKTILFPELIGFPVHWHSVSKQEVEKQGPFVMQPFSTIHLENLASSFAAKYPQTCFECYGVRIEYQGKAYVYSADLHVPEELKPVMGGTIKSLICELTHYPEDMLFKELAKYDIELIWLTHYPDRLVNQEPMLAELAKSLNVKGQVRLIEEKQIYDL